MVRVIYFLPNDSEPQKDIDITLGTLIKHIAEPPYAIRLRFEVTDPDGLHQAQVANAASETIGYKGLKGQSSTVEFVTTQLAITSETAYEIPFRVIDVHGNITEQWFPINLAPLLSRKVVSIPDANLAAVIRETIGLAPTAPIRQRDMLKLTELKASHRQITDLTGIEHAINLRNLDLTDNHIQDVSPLSALTHLNVLNLTNNAISDVSALAGLSDQAFLYLSGNPVFGNPGPKIEGPWLWMIAPTGRGGEQAALSGVDFLAQASGSLVTEQQIATKGATPGEMIGNKVWTSGKLAPIGDDNITHVINATNLGQGDINNHVAYGSIVLDSPRRQETTMYVGSDDAVKVWLNGVLVHSSPVDRGADDYQEFFPVVLKRGANILLVAVYEHGGGWSGFFGFKKDTVYSLPTPIDVSVDESVDVLIYTGGVWWITHSDAITEAQTTKRLLQAAGIQTEITQNEDAVKQWMQQTTSDGSVNVLIFYGLIPTTIYPPGNAMPDGSVAEKWIETRDGNTILNHADYLGFWSTGNINFGGRVGQGNGGGTLQNLMDIPNIFIPVDRNNIPMVVTTDGSALTPSLVNFQSDRPLSLNQLQGDWYAEKILASDTGDARATLADPVVVRDGDRGRIAIVHQTELEDNPKGEIAAELIINYLHGDVDAEGVVDILAGDVNADGVVNVKDLVYVAQRYQQTGTNSADVNGDKVVNVDDLVLVAAAIDAAAAAPSLRPQVQPVFSTAVLRQWLIEAKASRNASVPYQRGIRFLEQLLAALIPKETALLRNYPNPFNPETWIPYQLAKPGDVTLTIYSVNGKVVRRLVLGHQLAGVYQSKSRAAYWDDRNEWGEPVASGLYFYTLTAGDFAATGKMLILK